MSWLEEPQDDRPFPIGDEFRIPGTLTLQKQSFQTTNVSDSLLLCLKPNGVERKFWDFSRIAESSSNLFRLKVMDLPQVPTSKKHPSHLQTGPLDGVTELGGVASSSKSLIANVSPTEMDADGVAAGDGKPSKRADRYFDLLMKRHNQRLEADQKKSSVDERERAEGAAKQALEACIARANRAALRKSGAADQSVLTDEELRKLQGSDFGALTAYNGVLKIEIEVIVTRAPGEAYNDEEMGNDRDSAASNNSSRPSTPPIDFADDLAQLAEEMKDHTKTKAGDDTAEDETKKPKLANIWKNPHPIWTLDLGGSVFFVPDAERYAHAPSIPPPPPPSLQGRRRLRLKPRLPLEISHHRYRDEHPNIWPPDPYSPAVTDYSSFQQKLLTLDFYKSCSEGLSQLPRQQHEKDRARHEQEFGDFIMQNLRQSPAWDGWWKNERARSPTPPADAAGPLDAIAAPSAAARKLDPIRQKTDAKAVMPVGRLNYKGSAKANGAMTSSAVHL